MPKQYSEDLRWRAVWLHTVRGLSYAEVSDLLYMSERSVRRYTELYFTTGDVKPCRQRHGPVPLLSETEQLTVLQSMIYKPTIYLEELQHDLHEAFGTWVHLSTICRTVHRLGFTRKRVQQIAIQCSETLRNEYMAEISMFDPDMLIWVDETGSNRRDSIRTYGYSCQGMRAVSHVLRVSGSRINAIGILSTEGIEDVYLTEETVNGEVFERFVRTSLMPILKPFNGTNSHSVVVLDNASIHHMDNVIHLIYSTGALVRFLPPYSPDLNPIENAFSKVKSCLRANSPLYQSTTSPSTIVYMAFCTITKEDCMGYIRNAGYIE